MFLDRAFDQRVELRTRLGASAFVVAEFAKHNALTGFTRNLYFWRTTDQSEVDLVVQENARMLGYEMKISPAHDRRIHARSFSESYKTSVQIIHTDNFLEYIPGFTALEYIPGFTALES